MRDRDATLIRAGPSVDMAYPVPYFAYGLNMVVAGMRERCPHATLLGPARLGAYRLVFNAYGVASIVPAEGSAVEGLLWSITARCERELDRFERVPDNLYFKSAVVVRSDAGNATTALVYIATDATPGSPRPRILEVMCNAAAEHGLSGAYVAELSAWRRRGASG